MGGKGLGRSSAGRTHGTTSRYGIGCRCRLCRAAWSDYMRKYRGGPRKVVPYFGPKAVTVAAPLSPLGQRILDAAAARTGRSRGEVIEAALRLAGAQVSFEDLGAVA